MALCCGFLFHFLIVTPSDAVFGPSASSEEIYSTMAHQIVDDGLNGVNGAILRELPLARSLISFFFFQTVFSLRYGQTASGKTHTMRGTADRPGVVPLAVRHVFRRIAELGEVCSVFFFFFFCLSFLTLVTRRESFSFECRTLKSTMSVCVTCSPKKRSLWLCAKIARLEPMLLVSLRFVVCCFFFFQCSHFYLLVRRKWSSRRSMWSSC